MSEGNGAKWQVIILLISSIITIWLAGLTASVIANDVGSRERDTALTADLNCKYTIIIEKLTRLETQSVR
jgi:hypothetical protein